MGARALAREAFLGTPLRIVTGEAAEVALTDRGDGGGRERLIHGSFTFGLANYTAMLAVNHPFVLPGVSECRFLDPVKVGESMTPLAVSGRQRESRDLSVDVNVGDVKVLAGVFACFDLRDHFLG